jgi:hypothetical protein
MTIGKNGKENTNMKRLTILSLFVLLAMVISACAGVAAPAPAPTTAPAAQPTEAPKAVAPTDAPTATAAAEAPTFEGLSTGLDNAKQARIRTVNAVMGTSSTDVYINGLPVINGGKPQQNIAVSDFSGWLYVTPGTYTVALVLHGGTVEQALFEPVAIKAEAGHRYSVAAMGQMKEKDVKPLIVDETALIAGIGAKPTDDVWIDINNVTGIAGIAEKLAGKLVAPNVKYGEAMAYLCDIGRPHAITFVADKPDTILGQGDNTCEPATSTVNLQYGDYASGGAIGGPLPHGVSELNNVLDFLAGFNSYQVATDEGHLLTFNTVLAAIDKAGMRDQLANSGPYLFLAPTDEAFAALPKDQRDALLADPQALIAQLKAHLVEGYYPSGSFSGATYGQADREVTNLLGQKLRFLGDGLNGQNVLGANHMVGNGNRVQFIYKLLPVK